MAAELSLLGKTTDYKTQYDQSLLFPIARKINRDKIGVDEQKLPFLGLDIWTGYELSWLNLKGKPQVGIIEFEVPMDSPNLIESKSIKLYLNSFNQTRLKDVFELQSLIEKDLSAVAGKPVITHISLPKIFAAIQMKELDGTNIDDLDIEITEYQPNPSLLKTLNYVVDETLVSHLLRSNCLVTNQPDWGTVQVIYSGNAICQESLLRYFVSFREHNEFHEQCVERIFMDIMRQCKPEKLAVYARYTRRGGLDINPVRANFPINVQNIRTARQ